jgi:hypothetical protein
MNKKGETGTSKIADILVSAVCLGGALCCLMFFQIDLNRTLSRLNEKPVGTVTWKYRAAQRRFIDRVLWDRLQRESPVYDGDSIRTAALSEAVVSFAGGGVIDVAENTLIQIFVKNAAAVGEMAEGARIDLFQGNVDADAGDRALVLAAGEYELTIASGGAAKVMAGNGEHAEFRIRTGEASLSPGGLRREEAAVRTMTAGAAFRTAGNSGDETAGTRTPLVTAATPPPGARLLAPTPEGLGVRFTWNTVNYGSGGDVTNAGVTRLEAAYDRSFTRIAAALDLEGDGGREAQLKLAPGVYFWRVYAPADSAGVSNTEGVGNAALGGDASRLTILYTPPPGLIYPAEGSRHPWQSGGRLLRFRWIGPAAADAVLSPGNALPLTGDAAEPDYYLLEAADNPGMTGDVIRVQTRGASAEVSLPAPGRWFWRVLARYGDAFLPSQTGSFEAAEDLGFTAPEPLTPLPGGTVNISPEGRDPAFSWRPGTGTAYTIVISEHQDLSNPLITERVKENYYSYPVKAGLLGEGRYYWGVFVEDSGGNKSSLSPARPFTARAAETAPRAIFPPDNYTVAESLIQDIRFTWRSGVSSSLRIQIAGDPEFAALLVDEAVSGSAFQAGRLPPGTLYWRVAAAGNDAQPRYSGTNRLTVLAALPLPELAVPEGGASGVVNEQQVVVVQPGKQILFRWGPVEGAQYYEFRLYDAQGESGEMGKLIFSNSSLKDASIGMSMDSYKEGLYYWTVRPMAAEGALQSRLTGLMGKDQFILRKSGGLMLDYPPPGHAYSALDAQDRPGELRWSFLDTPRRTRFILSSNRNLSGRPLMDIADPGGTIRLVPLPPGTYYWTIRGESGNGADISASPSWFQVLATPSLAAAGNRQPPDNFVFGPEQLRGRRSITFSWNAVEGANAYIFTLEQEEEGQPSRRIAGSEPGPEQSYTLDNISLLTRGRFVWKVEPVYRNPDGSFIRRGTVGENRFTVDIPAIQRRDLEDMGTLYGH